MYKKHYGFKETPFNLTPNSKFFYASAKHTEAISTLVYAIRERKGFVVITGDIGSGKTTICRTLLNQLDTKTEVVLVTNTHISDKDLLTTILDDLDIEYVPGSKAKLLSQLNYYLIEQLRSDRNIVLILDEAQNLAASVLEEVRMLSNLETENEKLIQIIFIGQPELKKKLALARLEQLRQRIAVFYHLIPLSYKETREYILHRLKIASESDRRYFSDEALDQVWKYSKGVPRLVNQICDSALLTGYIAGVEEISAEIMQEVIAESPMNQISSGMSRALQKLDQVEHEKYERESLNIKIPEI
ncbi:MAG TPA: AAA family ATPase [Candidatus Omnitrophota bacterium]|nr:AAA family ATPase [Candidatus Omnitrophota bacterium]